ncbi:MAG: hypothetical protein WAV76_12095 [Bacteroidota bacterium]
MKQLFVLVIIVILFGACNKANVPDYNLMSKQILAAKNYTSAQSLLIINWCKEHHMVIYDADKSLANYKESIAIMADIEEPSEFGEKIAFLKKKLLSDNPKSEMSWRGENKIYTFTLINK